MPIYIILYLFLSLFSFYDKKHTSAFVEKVLMGFLVVIFTLFRGLRWNTGTDWVQYHEVFLEADWSTIFTFQRYGESGLEFGYVFLNVLVKSLGGNYTVFLLITNFIVLYSAYLFSHRISKFPLLTFIIILYISPFFPVRLTLAAAVLLFSYPYVVSGSFLWFLVPTLLAFTIHTSALIFVPSFFLLRRHVPTPWAIGIFLVTMLLSNEVVQRTVMTFVANSMSLFGNMVSIRLEYYMDHVPEEENMRSHLLSNILSFALLLLFSWVRAKDDEYKYSMAYNVCYNSYLIYFAISEFFRLSMIEMVRVANYFSFGFPVLAAAAVVHLAGRKESRGLIYAIFICYMFYKFYITLHMFQSSNIPYRSILD